MEGGPPSPPVRPSLLLCEDGESQSFIVISESPLNLEGEGGSSLFLGSWGEPIVTSNSLPGFTDGSRPLFRHHGGGKDGIVTVSFGTFCFVH